LETDEQTVNPPELLIVSFEKSTTFAAEGDQAVQVKVSLNQPSVSGFEEATINLTPFATNFNVDFTALEQYPVTLTWAIGEQDKFLTFNINNDFEEELLEPFLLQITGIINLNPGNFVNTTVYIEDRTQLNYVSLERALYPPDNSGVTHLLVDEGSDIDFSIKLDHPAFGVEKVVLDQVSVLNTINGNIGPAANPLNPADYVLVQSIPGSPPLIITTPHTITFNVGEISKEFLLFVKDNSTVNEDKIAYFDLKNAQFCKLDQSKKMAEITAKDDDGIYKYAHLNLGRIYSEFGDGGTNTLMRQLNPQPGFFGDYGNLYINQYSHYLIPYGKTIRFKDYSASGVQGVKFVQPTIKLKITNLGTFQGIVNNSAINPNQSKTLVVTGDEFIVTATTNANKNLITNFYEDAIYKIELINNYDAHGEFNASQIAPSISGFNPFKLKDLDNTESISKTLNIGTFTIPGFNVASSDISKAYHLKSKYNDINTARLENTSGNFTCPAVSSFSNSVSFSEFYKITIENISVFGIIFLNLNSVSNYNGFEFADYTQSANYTCNMTNSEYNGLDYVNLPFTIEP
jgi:hypothetical protein